MTSITRNISNQLERLLAEFQLASKPRQQELAVEIRTQAEAYHEITGTYYFKKLKPVDYHTSFKESKGEIERRQ